MLRRRMRVLDQQLTGRPDSALTEYLRIPEKFVSPASRIFRRVLYATLALFAAVLIVYLDRDGYRDVQENPMSFLDCLYYATVSLSTTGYGDITPFTPSARLINVLVITPLRVAFLIVLIGTTVETLTAASRQALKIQRWRNSVRNHTVVIGYGTEARRTSPRWLVTVSRRARSSSSTPIRPRWTTPVRRAWSRCAATPTAPMCCGSPAPSTPRPSSWPPAATPPPSW